MAFTEVVGLIGAGLAGAAYAPQIAHMVRQRCVAGVSRSAFWVWFIASALVLSHAIATRDAVFVVLGIVQTSATAFISVYVTLNAGRYCEGHMRPSLDPTYRPDRGQRSTGRSEGAPTP